MERKEFMRRKEDKSAMPPGVFLRMLTNECFFGDLCIIADGRKGEQPPYDAIHAGAAAADVPQDLIDQLKPRGRTVIPVGTFFQDLKVINKKLDGSISVPSETSVRYVPLTSREAQIKGT
ncbi:hypothetical protein K7X08_034939 [Anisodus acutangulus]|uniref:Uncharacterized protein n=1 Tax=Anisodus acutangulus TaxID=402998 RepID=A0A9Q1R243_9SOLA|nr:hypothetical protein K7X08_034939 [Anisodus acutangulus]